MKECYQLWNCPSQKLNQKNLRFKRIIWDLITNISEFTLIDGGIFPNLISVGLGEVSRKSFSFKMNDFQRLFYPVWWRNYNSPTFPVQFISFWCNLDLIWTSKKMGSWSLVSRSCRSLIWFRCLVLFLRSLLLISSSHWWTMSVTLSNI